MLARETSDAMRRLERFAPVLSELFPEAVGWNGRIESKLSRYPSPPAGTPRLFVKADHDLPMTGSVKARGGIYELLCFIERELCTHEDLRTDDYRFLTSRENRQLLATRTVVVASTGNLGFSIGLVARRFGLRACVHMSSDAVDWKKKRLRDLGVEVIEHDADYTQTVAAARAAASATVGAHFIDDESSRELFVGYATVAGELRRQLEGAGIAPSIERPLVVYLPCGVGGAPGGITYAVKSLYGSAAICVFVEPIESACVFAAMSVGGGRPISVYEIGLSNRTRADGLAVPRASGLALQLIGPAIDAVAAVRDESMAAWVARCWREARLRLELSAAAGFAALQPFSEAVSRDAPELAVRMSDATHLVWTTGGAMQPAQEFERLLRG